MNWADWAIIAIVAISSLISVARGFVKEAFSLAVWVLAFFVAVAFHERLAALMADSVASVSLRYIFSYIVLFIATLLLGSMVKHLLGQLVKATGLSGTDRLLGMAFGLSRGLIIVMALLILLPMAIPVNQDRWWLQSQLIPHFMLMEQWSKDTFALLVDTVSRFFV